VSEGDLLDDEDDPELPELDELHALEGLGELDDAEPQTVIVQGPRHVLVADPEPRERARLVALLQALSSEVGRLVVHTAEDGLAALALVEQHRPALVVAEVLLPGISGLALLRRLTRALGAAAPAFVFVTAMVRESDRYWGLRSGAHGYIMKPYDDELVRAKLRDVLAADASLPELG
jgi:CheY-like chemotaxis protein